MKPKTALIIILILSVLGLLFSAYFAYYDTWGKGCVETVIECPEEGGDIVSDVPICLYGLVINLLVIIFSLLGLLGKGKPKEDEGGKPKMKAKEPELKPLEKGPMEKVDMDKPKPVPPKTEGPQL